jgi:hypothetical protein
MENLWGGKNENFFPSDTQTQTRSSDFPFFSPGKIILPFTSYIIVKIVGKILLREEN